MVLFQHSARGLSKIVKPLYTKSLLMLKNFIAGKIENIDLKTSVWGISAVD
jgi:hypothetical protein